MKKVCILSGAGISAESGIRTFRDSNGLWEDHDIMEVASPEGWERNPEMVLHFYNERRKDLKNVLPNQAHKELVELEKYFNTVVITQNVDDLHERAGSKNIIHLHGELLKVRSTLYPHLVYDWPNDLQIGDSCEKNAQLRPHIVWFGEAVPMLENAIQEISSADAIMIIGTSMKVYPAASLTSYAPRDCKILYIDPVPQINYELGRANHLKIFKGPATQKVKEAIHFLIQDMAAKDYIKRK